MHVHSGARHRRTRWTLLVTVAVVVGLVVTPVVATGQSNELLAETDRVTVTADGDWVRFGYKTDLDGLTARGTTHKRRYQGVRAHHGGCVYSGTETADPDTLEGIVEEREVARNDADCVMVTEVGYVRGPDTAQAGAAHVTEIAKGDRTDAEAGSTGLAAAAATRKRAAWHRTYHEDPPGIDVTSVKTSLRWKYNGSCVLSSWSHGARYSWFDESGWRKVFSSTTKSRTCSRARTHSNSEFLNPRFCATIDTRTKYKPNQINGQEDGRYTMRWTADAWGGCSGLLSFHRRHGYFNL